jgi:hypothetical protein
VYVQAVYWLFGSDINNVIKVSCLCSTAALPYSTKGDRELAGRSMWAHAALPWNAPLHSCRQLICLMHLAAGRCS